MSFIKSLIINYEQEYRMCDPLVSNLIFLITQHKNFFNFNFELI